jgi:hypothetical protein
MMRTRYEVKTQTVEAREQEEKYRRQREAERNAAEHNARQKNRFLAKTPNISLQKLYVSVPKRFTSCV